MKVILLKSVPKVGKKDDVIEVAAGYAQHSLFPNKLAIAATPASLAAVVRRKQNTVAEKEVRHRLLDAAIESLRGVSVSMTVKANEQGSLFSKIHANDIAEFLSTTHRISISPETLELADGPIKTLGLHTVRVHDDGFSADFTIELVKE
ncbi:MAG: 50S ribosomal protein L9 [Candidatus Pacebacteria bacterium]|nr:50S ribosomal protein L9 [Candidatus Paceibacterota bacterium]MBP9700840.1 50S ribosomal protein L9 [Candidatus Paceibacterota bacterium]